MAWRFGACQTSLGSRLKFMGVNVKRPRQHACSHLSSDALIVSCFWCLVFLLYYTPLGLREATNIGRASSPSVSMVFMDSPKKCLSYRNFSTFSPIYFFSIGILGMPVQRFCGIRYAGCCTMLMQNAAPFYASKTNLSGANCRSTTLCSEISLQLLHSRLHNRLIPVVQRSLLEKSGGKCFRFRTAAALQGVVSVVAACALFGFC